MRFPNARSRRLKNDQRKLPSISIERIARFSAVSPAFLSLARSLFCMRRSYRMPEGFVFNTATDGLLWLFVNTTLRGSLNAH